jgi:hypothetical protein
VPKQIYGKQGVQNDKAVRAINFLVCTSPKHLKMSDLLWINAVGYLVTFRRFLHFFIWYLFHRDVMTLEGDLDGSQ